VAVTPTQTPVRKQRSDGARSRDTILREAAQLATVEGIDGLSISRLADAVGMSKSGLFAHFGSKQELQLATIEKAVELFNELVLDPANAAPTGHERLELLGELFFQHVENRVYPGGCFFSSVAAELDTRSGPVRDRAVECVNAWLGQLETAAATAQSEGSVSATEDPDQLAFELDAILLLANARFVAAPETKPMDRARRAYANRLAAAAP
jgi:AcrR family transcriptional regulator